MEDLHQKTLHVAFAGTPKLAADLLNTLLEKSKHQIKMVLTQPDKLSGRGHKPMASAVKIMALKHGIDILQPNASKLITLEHKIAEIDLMIVAAYGVLLPEAILKAPTYGCINVHASLLPRWRGAAPIQRAIQAGDNETGITIMQMDSGLDTGSMLLQKKCSIGSADTAANLYDKLTSIGNECLLEILDTITLGNLDPVSQDESVACYAEKITKSEARIDWTQSATDIHRTIRAFNPVPVCHTKLQSLTLRIWQAEVLDGKSTALAGEVIQSSKAGIDVATGNGMLRILQLQPPGKRVMSAADFLNGHPKFADGTSLKLH